MGDACVIYVLYMCNGCIICVYDKSIIVYLCKYVLYVNILYYNSIFLYIFVKLTTNIY